MSNLAIPIVLIAASVGLFFTFIDPTYKEAKVVSAEVKTYDQALDNSKELIRMRDELEARYQAMASSKEDLSRIELLLPNTVDNIRLVLDIDTIAARYGAVIKDLNISSLEKNKEVSKISDIKSVDLSFSVSTDYDTFIKFIKDLQDSLRIVEITRINFTVSETKFNTYNVTIRTFWLP